MPDGTTGSATMTIAVKDADHFVVRASDGIVGGAATAEAAPATSESDRVFDEALAKFKAGGYADMAAEAWSFRATSQRPVTPSPCRAKRPG